MTVRFKCVDVTVEAREGGPHVFLPLPTRSGAAVCKRIIAELRG